MAAGKKVIVFGAGVCGMTAAYRLKQAGFDPLVLESRDYPGGRTRSISKDGFIIDEGASIFPAGYVEALALVKELGLTDQLNRIPTKFAMFQNGKLFNLDMTTPLRTAWSLPSVGFWDKLSLLRIVPTLLRHWNNLTFSDLSAAAETDIETLKQFCQRKGISDNAYEFVLNPILKCLGSDEGDHASVTHLLWIMRHFMTTKLYAFYGGFNTLAKEIAKHVDVRYDTRVVNVSETADGVEVVVSDAAGRQEQLKADYCAIGTHGPDLNAVYGDKLTATQRQFLTDMIYTPSTLVTFMTEVRPESDALVIAVPKTEVPDLCVLVQNHYYAPTRAPDNKGLITFTGMLDWQKKMYGQPHEIIKKDALRLASQVLPVLDQIVEDIHVNAWEYGYTITVPGHFKKLAQFNADRVANSRVQYSGDYMSISTVGTAVSTGNDLARRIQTSHRLN